MATLIIPGAAQVTIRSTCSGQDVVNVIGVQNTVGASPASILNSVKAAWEAPGGPLTQRTSLLTMEGYDYIDLGSATGPTGFLGSTKAGSQTGAIATMASSALITLGGGTRSRSQRGRMYHGPLTEAQINPDGRTLAPSSIISLNAAYEQFRVALNSATSDWIVLSRKNLIYTIIGQVSTSSIIATQRRRLR